MRRYTAILAFLCVTLLFPTAALGAAPTAGGPMTVGIAAEPNSLDPALTDFTDNRTLITTQILETLVTYATAESLSAPGLAESWSVSADGLIWTFTIRSGVTFHDGTALNAAAVVFNLQRWWDPAHPYHNGAFDYFGLLFGGFKGDPDCLITNIAAAGASQVRITLQRPFSPLPSMLAVPALAIASPAAITAGMLDDHPVGTGPFRFTSWTAGDNIRLAANSTYWRGAPKVGPLTFKIIPAAADRMATLLANTIQVDAEWPADQAVPVGPLRLAHRPSSNTTYLGINRNHTPLDDVRVRQAIAHALDKPALVSSQFTANNQLATQLVPPAIWGRVPGLSDYTHDVALARSLLTQAGYPSGVSTTLATRDAPERIAQANAVKAQLAAADIEVTVLVYDWTTFLQKVRDGEVDLFWLGWNADHLHPANFLNDLVCMSWQYFGPRDDALCQAMVRAQMATTFSEQLTEYQWGSQRVFDTLPLIPLAHAHTLRMDRSEVIGVVSRWSWDEYWLAAYAETAQYLPLVTR